MPETLERVTAKPSTPRSVFIFRFGSTLVLWSIALGIIFSGYELAFFALIGTLGMLSLWEFYRMLDHKGLPNFKVTAMICGAVMLCGSFYYFSRIGRHQMIPHISPKKTWEGFFGALAFSLLASWGMWKLMPLHLPGLGLTHAIVLGLLLGFAAVVGDLAESIVKRSTGVKDSGNLLPGIGGALDLVDSLLFTAPLLFFYLRLVIRVS